MGLMDDINAKISDPYKDAKISILLSCKYGDELLGLCDNLLSSSKDVSDVEFLVKIDNYEEAKKCQEILEHKPFQYKILIYPSFYGRMSNHIAFNNLYNISSGKLIWFVAGDCRIVKGDWYKTFSKFLDENVYKDRIFNIAVPMDNGKGYKQICGINVVTREWCDFFNGISPLPNADRWLSKLSREIGRCFNIEESELLSHYPKGRRTLSKQQRKDLFKPSLKKAVRKFREKCE